ncbi:MAG TPA: preprotein translocase subunit YajC [Gaiellaceae bacterium]|nr:preprotein translocase subunit YajC [Gaiellaceae bacterium]
MSGLGFLIIIVAFGFLYFVLVRPQKRRQLESQRMLSSLQVGSEVLTAGGVYGRVIELQGDALLVEIAPGVQVKVARRAIGGVIPPEEPEAEEEPPPVENGG